ncbi:MAG: efflux RND transporter permease subunit [Okeania sp. SIO2G4]|uniref:efflux RND transporter permease subunit n=1 Tax=unclassified Okeania TaxID=2634635 RepID=UPI0013B5D2A6|nr:MULTISPECIES: efflux RND transporter permease subunit [unclassified Okeania]NEP73217.1 efflux RND transporter permease subunit [Okeania sp. SIO2G5]NEP94081.1 efflux RND transporter permease subunit [Okeania sp. SIO2F5]NEQ91912.1 efflux RND transporter permease subunit [Okeania sp. SIO2G4]
MKQSTAKNLRQRWNISRWAIAKPWLTICFWLSVVIAGFFAFSSLKYGLFPEVSFPVVVVQATANFDNTIETETQITTPIEKAVKILETKGMYELRSSTYPGQAVINIAFTTLNNLKSATADVETALKQVPLPPETNLDIISLDLNESAAISYAIISDSKTLRELTAIAQNQIIPTISKLPEVLKVNLLGDASLKQKDTDTLLPNTFPTLVSFNHKNAIAFQVVKRADANTLEAVSKVEATVAKMQSDLPEIKLALAETQADYIQEATQATIDALLLAIILAVAVIFPFLRNFPATIITALAIPISLLGTCIVMAIFGFNLETITLLALAIIIGIIVDDAIVDVENIARHLEAGETPKQAAINGTDEIGLTVVASTCTIAAVFLPVAFMGDTLGQFFQPFGLTVSAAVLISLLVARTLSPVLAVWWLNEVRSQKSEGRRQKAEGRRQKAEGNNNEVKSYLTQDGLLNQTPIRSQKSEGNYDEVRSQELEENNNEVKSYLKQDNLLNQTQKWENTLSHQYQKLLNWSLDHRKVVIAIALLSFILGMAMIPLIPKGLVPQLDRGEFNITYTYPLPNFAKNTENFPPPQANQAPANNSIFPEGAFNWISGLTQSPTRILLRKSRRVAQNIEEIVLSSPEVESVFSIAGFQGEPNRGKIYVKLKKERSLTTAQIQKQTRKALSELKNISVSVEDIPFVETGAGKPFEVMLLGDNREIIYNTAQKIQTQIAKLPGFVDLTIAPQYNNFDNPMEITHRSQKQVIYITANLSEGLGLGNAIDLAVEIAQPILPPGVKLDLGGDSLRVGEVFGSFFVTLGFSVVCMLTVLVLLFGRFLEPLVVGLCLPLSIVGAMLGLLFTQSDFGVISLLGLIFLLGLLDKNALLLMDYINQLRQSGLERRQAILQTGLVRLRPILMTTSSTVLGMLPIALGLGAGAELRQPLAVAIIGGLITSTLLSLIVVPVLYTLLEDWWKLKLSGLTQRHYI